MSDSLHVIRLSSVNMPVASILSEVKGHHAWAACFCQPQSPMGISTLRQTRKAASNDFVTAFAGGNEGTFYFV